MQTSLWRNKVANINKNNNNNEWNEFLKKTVWWVVSVQCESWRKTLLDIYRKLCFYFCSSVLEFLSNSDRDTRSSPLFGTPSHELNKSVHCSAPRGALGVNDKISRCKFPSTSLLRVCLRGWFARENLSSNFHFSVLRGENCSTSQERKNKKSSPVKQIFHPSAAESI